MMKLGLYLTLLFMSVWTASGEPFKCSNICGKGAIIIAGVAYCCPQGYKPMLRRKMEDAFMATDCDCLFMMPAGGAMYGHPHAGQGHFIIQQPVQAPVAAVAAAAPAVQAAAPPPPATVVAAPPAPPPYVPAPAPAPAPAARMPIYKPMYRMIRQPAAQQQRTWYHRPAPTQPAKTAKSKHDFFKFLDDFLRKQGYRTTGNRV